MGRTQFLLFFFLLRWEIIHSLYEAYRKSQRAGRFDNNNNNNNNNDNDNDNNNDNNDDDDDVDDGGL